MWLSGGSRRALRAGRMDWKQKGKGSPRMLSSMIFTLGRMAGDFFHEGAIICQRTGQINSFFATIPSSDRGHTSSSPD